MTSNNEPLDILKELASTIRKRKTMDPESSYVAQLHKKGLNKMLEKVGEEATEVIIAAKDASDSNTDSLISEMADLWFHSMIVLSHFNLSHEEILTELEKRFGLSGIEEKASRSER